MMKDEGNPAKRGTDGYFSAALEVRDRQQIQGLRQRKGNGGKIEIGQ
jgi:hypothetical protein